MLSTRVSVILIICIISYPLYITVQQYFSLGLKPRIGTNGVFGGQIVHCTNNVGVSGANITFIDTINRWNVTVESGSIGNFSVSLNTSFYDIVINASGYIRFVVIHSCRYYPNYFYAGQLGNSNGSNLSFFLCPATLSRTT